MMGLLKTIEELNEEGRRNKQLYEESLKGNQEAGRKLQEKAGEALITGFLYIFGLILVIGFIGAIILMVLISILGGI